jgi:DDE superfamily endonuclease
VRAPSVNAAACRLYNFRLGQIRVVSENCFSKVKGRWSILRNLPFAPALASKVVYTACCLLNFAESQKETMLQRWIRDFDPIDLEYTTDAVNTQTRSSLADTVRSGALSRKVQELKRMGLR